MWLLEHFKLQSSLYYIFIGHHWSETFLVPVAEEKREMGKFCWLLQLVPASNTWDFGLYVLD